jgi:hypothetical protein
MDYVSIRLFDAPGADEDDRTLCERGAVRVVEKFGVERAKNLHLDFLEKLEAGDSDAENGEHPWAELEMAAESAATRMINQKYFERRSCLSDWFGDGAHLEFYF